MDRIRSNVDSDVTLESAAGSIAGDSSSIADARTSDVGTDGRFVVHFHHDAKSLAAWFRRCEKSRIKRPRRSARHVGPAVPEQGPFTAGPRLNIAIHIVGSRGDVQPFIPIAQLLIKEPYHYRVRICTHPVFKEFVESEGVEFFSIGGDPEALMAYMVKNRGLMPSRQSLKAGELGRRREEMWEIINGAWRSCIEAGDGMSGRLKAARVRNVDDLFVADAIIANPPSMAHIHCAEKLGIPLHMVFTMPWSPTENFAHPLAALSYGKADAKTANYLSFVIMELLTWQGLGDVINKFRDQKLGLDPISPMWGFQLLSRLRVPFDYLWSQSLVPKPDDWGPNINISGFSFLPLARNYRPSPDLIKFLSKGHPPIYVGFGSIVVDDPVGLMRLVLDAISLAGVRAIVSRGWGAIGLDEAADIPESVYLIEDCPHDWLFKRVSMVVHHGGAGTTATGIKHGRPTVVVPFFGDQRFWGEMIARAGAGPEPVPFKEMTAEALAGGIVFCRRAETVLAAQRMAQGIAHEDGAFDAVRDFKNRLDPGQFRCDLCPQRLAAWRHKRTDIHLSGFAVACLADRGIIRPADVRLLQRKHWYVDEGAENPLVGVAAAFTCLIAAVATATSDFSRGLKSQRDPGDDPSGPRASIALQPSQEPLSINILGGDEANRAIASEFPSHSGLRRLIPDSALSPGEMETLALKLARRSVRGTDPAENVRRTPSFHDKQMAAWHGREQGRNGRRWYVARLAGRYAIEVGRAGLKAPVAFFYNVANGFHNFPSYGFAGVEVRRRDEITGFESGLSTAGKEFVMGMWTAVSGVVVQPYQTIRQEGARGTGKGLWRGVKGLVSNVGAATFGLPGYTLKGVEKECEKRHLTRLKAELILIRLRQAIQDFRRATPSQREEVITKWNALTE